jgi:hypothetical protein
MRKWNGGAHLVQFKIYEICLDVKNDVGGLRIPNTDVAVFEMNDGFQSAGAEGSFQAAINKLDHIVDTGFTGIQLMPVLEFSGSWGYNPRLLFPTHQVAGRMAVFLPTPYQHSFWEQKHMEKI